jgi:hypothetical protein
MQLVPLAANGVAANGVAACFPLPAERSRNSVPALLHFQPALQLLLLSS